MKKIVKILLPLSLLLLVVGCSKGEQVNDPEYYAGNPNAKVVISEYSDYECPACGSLHANAYQNIKEEYIDTGLVRWEFNDFPLPFHSYAKSAAQGAYCGGEQDKYWEMNEMLFANQRDLSLSAMNRYAENLGLDVEEFEACVQSKSYFDVIENNYKEGVSRGVDSTPTIFVNDIKVTGAQPFETFKKIIDQQIAENQ